MNENNRRGGGVFVTAEPRKDTGMEIHQLPSFNRDDFKTTAVVFHVSCAFKKKMTRKV